MNNNYEELGELIYFLINSTFFIFLKSSSPVTKTAWFSSANM